MELKVKSEKAFSISLDAGGRLDKIFYRNQVWNGYTGGLILVDELRGRIFRSGDAETVLTESSDNRAVFTRRWADGDFVLREIWTAGDDCLAWRVEAELNPGCPERSIQIKQCFPYPYPAYNLQVWSANERFPCPLEELGGLHLYYGDVCYGTIIPAITLYDARKNSGFTLAKPFGLKTARLAFHFKDYHSDGLEVENTCLFLGNGKPAVAELLIHAHEGCWRPGLGWLYNKYREYFNPPNPRVHELEGGFMISNPYTENAYLKTVGKYKIKWAEIHNHFPMYGNYAPDETEWDSVIRHDYPDLPAPPEKLSRTKINRHIASLHDNGIRGLLYFQCSGDAFIPYVENNFPDAIARDHAGKLIPAWKECCFVNASPGTSFHRHIKRQLDKFLADYPAIDGVFLDQVCYQALDTAHHDGVTAYDNKPAAMFGYSYDALLEELAARLHKQHKILWGNGPFNVEVQKTLDGIMAEGTGKLAGTYQYLCLNKPLLVHTYPEDPKNVEAMFRHCLLCGASYSLGASSSLPVPKSVPPQSEKIFSRCVPLAEKLFGKRWVFAPNPLKLPPRYQGNIFYAPDGGSVLVSLVSSFDSLLNPVCNIENKLRIQVKLEFDRPVSRVESFSCHTPEAIKAEFARTADGLEIELAEHSVMSVVIIK